MKNAKFSSVYERRGRKGAEKSSMSARMMAAKGRRDGVGAAKKAFSTKPKHRTMVTRSMKVTTMEEIVINEHDLHDVVIIQGKLDQNGSIIPIEVPVQQAPQEVVQMPQEVVQQVPQEVVQQKLEVVQQKEEVVQEPKQEVVQPKEGEQPPVNAVPAVAENRGDHWDLFDWDDSLMYMKSDDSDEAWPWLKVEHRAGWDASWEALTGQNWTQPFMDGKTDHIWSDLWDFNDDKYLFL